MVIDGVLNRKIRKVVLVLIIVWLLCVENQANLRGCQEG